MPSVAILGTRGYPSYYGGFETAVRYIAPYLVRKGWDVDVYSRRGSVREDDNQRDHRVSTRYSNGIDAKSISTLSYGFSSSVATIRRKTDVALVMNVANGYWLPMLRLAGIPTLVNVDGIEWERAKWSRLGKAVFRQGARLTAKHATEIVVDAEAIGSRWSADFGRDGIFIPYGGARIDSGELEEGLTSGTYALMVARFVPENTVPEFLEAARTIARTRDVVIVGSTGYGGELDTAARELAAAEPRVRWLGHVNDDARLSALWRNAGAYFHGHSVGGTNPALVQAMANRAPVVARDTIYNREVLGGNGVFVQPEPRAIADAVLGLIADAGRRAELQEAAAIRADSIYSWENVCNSYEVALRGLVGAASRQQS